MNAKTEKDAVVIYKNDKNRNQLTSTLTKDSKVSFTYDAEGLRISKTVNGEEPLYIWDNDQLVLELTKSGKEKKRYIRGNDLIYADEGEVYLRARYYQAGVGRYSDI